MLMGMVFIYTIYTLRGGMALWMVLIHTNYTMYNRRGSGGGVGGLILYVIYTMCTGGEVGLVAG